MLIFKSKIPEKMSLMMDVRLLGWDEILRSFVVGWISSPSKHLGASGDPTIPSVLCHSVLRIIWPWFSWANPWQWLTSTIGEELSPIEEREGRADPVTLQLSTPYLVFQDLSHRWGMSYAVLLDYQFKEKLDRLGSRSLGRSGRWMQWLGGVSTLWSLYFLLWNIFLISSAELT